jgi:hypothetical protein
MLRMDTKIDCYLSLRLDEKKQHHRPAPKRRKLEFTSSLLQSLRHMKFLWMHVSLFTIYFCNCSGLDLSARWGCALFLPHAHAARFSAPMNQYQRLPEP